ncbi:MAG TPA: undecaprenyl/decaprenyl-phosphate alpha-N-acetylglucosaminyl 1-phosphate transferase [Candidatus Onthocola stercorigallinarum]|nr:undecaprenyl/decaprenyl-phosphate alpha-N-acetylglucosaminyl 1-phosphate transferase [Candidatus Onthocola stercorigallinarum]
MDLVVNGHNVFVIVIVTFLASLILVPIVKKIAIHINAMDEPNERKIHKVPMPRLGGLAIFLAFLLGYMLYGEISTQMLSILIGSFLLILVGIVDDINSVKARYKLIVQIVAAAIVVLYGELYFTNVSLLGFNIYFNEFWGSLTSIIFIVAITNAINLIDGLDGLAAGISSIYFLTIAIIAFILNRIGGLDVIISLIMLGSTLGFLFHNFPPAKIFMGDTGSLFLGFMISVIALLGYKVTTFTSLIVPIIILAIPIFDTVFAIIRRLLKGQNIGVADKEHFHHQLLKMKYSPTKSILIIYVIDIAFAAVSIFYILGDNQIAIAIYVVLMILLLFVILKTDILFEHKKNANVTENVLINNSKPNNNKKKKKKGKKGRKKR